MTPDEIGASIAKVRGLTQAPFAVNLWVSTSDPIAGDEAAALAALGQPSMPRVAVMDFAAQARAVLDASPAVFSFITGVPPAEVLTECRDRGIYTIATATTPDEAVALADAGVDAIVASGFEAGGHRGSFLAPAEDSLIGTIALVPQVVDAVPGKPVYAAGGIADARGVRAARALGATGVQVGTRFLACVGSGASEDHRRALLAGRYTPTVLSPGFTGRHARGLATPLARTVQHAPYLSYPRQRALVKQTGGQQWWSGQAAGLDRGESATDVVRELAAAL